jgi:hypothetical protein
MKQKTIKLGKYIITYLRKYDVAIHGNLEKFQHIKIGTYIIAWIKL